MADFDRTSWTAYATSTDNGDVTNYGPAKTIDGSTGTYWKSQHSGFGGGGTLPSSLWVDMGSSQLVNYVRYRKTESEWPVWPNEVKVYVSDDGSDWTEVAHAYWPHHSDSDKIAVFTPVTKRWLRLTVITARASDGTASGTNATYDFNCREFNAGYDLGMYGTLSVTAPASDEGTVGTPYSYSLTVDQGTPPYSSSVISGALPTGCTVSGAGVVSGTPTVGGAFSATIRVTDATADYRDVATSFYIFKPGSPEGGATVWQILGIGRVEFTQPPAPDFGGVMQLYYATDYTALGESGFPPEASWPLLSPPVALYQFGGTTFTAQDFTFFTVSTSITDFSLTAVWPAIGGSAFGAPDALTTLKIYRFWLQIDWTDGTRTYVYPGRVQTLTGSGSVDDPANAIDGDTSTYAELGRSHFVPLGTAPKLRLDQFGVLPPPAVICDNPPGGVVGVVYTHAFPASSGLEPYTWSITAGELPPGLALNASTGAVIGTPTTAGSYSFTVTVTDDTDSTSSVDCSIAIAEPGNLWLDLWVWRELFRLDTVEQEITFPPGYERALMLQLAAEFSRQYPGHDLQALKVKLAAAVAQIDMENVSNSQALEELPPPEEAE